MEQKPKQKIQTEDEDMASFVSLLSHVKKMNPGLKLLCRMEIQRSVYAHINEGSSSQNKSSYVLSPVILESKSTQSSENSRAQVQNVSDHIHIFQEQCINDKLVYISYLGLKKYCQ